MGQNAVNAQQELFPYWGRSGMQGRRAQSRRPADSVKCGRDRCRLAPAVYRVHQRSSPTAGVQGACCSSMENKRKCRQTNVTRKWLNDGTLRRTAAAGCRDGNRSSLVGIAYEARSCTGGANVAGEQVNTDRSCGAEHHDAMVRRNNIKRGNNSQTATYQQLKCRRRSVEIRRPASQ